MKSIINDRVIPSTSIKNGKIEGQFNGIVDRALASHAAYLNLIPGTT